jgi:hypothetical protein
MRCAAHECTLCRSGIVELVGVQYFVTRMLLTQRRQAKPVITRVRQHRQCHVKPRLLLVSTQLFSAVSILLFISRHYCATMPRWLLLSCTHFLDQPISNTGPYDSCSYST